MFNNAPSFVFNMGGGPGVRVHQFGGGQARRRPRDPNAPPETPQSFQQTLLSLLPILVILILPLISSFLSGGGASGPTMRFDAAVPPHTMARKTPLFNVPYFINPAEVSEFSASKFKNLDKQAEATYIQDLRVTCESERNAKMRLQEEAQGWFFPDMEKLAKANMFEMKGCSRLEEMARTAGRREIGHGEL